MTTTPALNDDLTPAERKRQRKLPLNASGKLRELALAHWAKIADPSSRVDAVLVKGDGHVVIEWSEPTGKRNIIRDDGRFSIPMDRLFKDAALEAQSKEIEALRAALESIAKPAVGAGHDWSLNERAVYWRDQVALAREIARTALKGALASPSTPVDGAGAEPRVKPLEWDGDFAHTSFGLFYFLVEEDDGYLLQRYDGTLVAKSFHGLRADAIDAAQADYDKRILSALANPEAEARLRERVAESEVVCNSYADENQRLYDRAIAAEARLAQAEGGPGSDDESELLTIAYMMGSHDAKKRQSEGGPSMTDPYDLQLLAHLKRDNVAGGARPVIEGDMKAWDQARRLSKEGYIAIEQMGRGGALHITLKGVAALEAALHPQSADGEEGK